MDRRKFVYSHLTTTDREPEKMNHLSYFKRSFYPMFYRNEFLSVKTKKTIYTNQHKNVLICSLNMVVIVR